MAFPTRHWINFSGVLGAGARITQAHGLRSGLYQPQAAGGGANGNDQPQVLFAFNGVTTAPPNVNVGMFAAPDATNVYLSNYDPANARPYSVMVRMYHRIDGQNF